MISTNITKELLGLTQMQDLEQSLKLVIPEYIRLKIFLLKNEIAHYEMKWGMNYQDFEKESANMPDGFSYEIEQEYYDWGKKEALLEFYKEKLKAWIGLV